MLRLFRLPRWPRRWFMWIAAGIVLRLLFIWFPRPGDDDTLDYLQLGHNLLHYGIYGMGASPDLSPTMYRLPAYPIFVATFEFLFARIWPNAWLNAVFLFQTAVDLASGLLLVSFARRHLSDRAAEVALVLAMLCPVTAAYAGIALTECSSVFAISLGLYATGRVLAAQASGSRDFKALILAGLASALATLLRPDGIVLFASIGLALIIGSVRSHSAAQQASSASPNVDFRRNLATISIFCIAALLPLVPWTVRNWEDFHVFQPLAPRYADPGENSIAGARRWLRTWTMEYVNTANVCWNFPGDTIDLADIPARAYDSPDQRAQTIALIAEYNRTTTLPPSLDARFAAIADQRIHEHLLRYYVVLPLLRDADMLLRPRTIEFDLDVFWWRWSEHPAQSAWAIFLGLINLFYVAAAAWAFLRCQVPWPWLLGSYLILRFIVLGAMENPEPRYTVQCFPIFIVAAAAVLTHLLNRWPCSLGLSVPWSPLPVRQSSSGRFLMRLPYFCPGLLVIGCALALVPASLQAQSQPEPAQSFVPLVLVGGTVVDVTAWGDSAHDIPGAIVVIRDGRIVDVGLPGQVSIPKDARIIDCAGKFLIPGLIDGYAGMNSQAQANANLYMGVTTVVARADSERGFIDTGAQPTPHIYPIDTIGVTDNWSLLARHPDWVAKLREGVHPAELGPQDTARQIVDTSHIGTRVLILTAHITAANSQWIIARAHQEGLVTYGDFVATPDRVGDEAGVDALTQMDHYDLGVIPDELQRPLVDDPDGPSADTAYDYSERIPPTDVRLRNYAHFLATHHAALLPAFSLYYVQLPDHRDLWKEPAAALLDPGRMYHPTDPATGEMMFPLPTWSRHLPATAQHWEEEDLQKKAGQSALRLWHINQTIFSALPHYLAGSGADAMGTMPGISLHTELELLVRLGLSPREALAAATNNYALQFGWNELGLIASGRRADILVLDSDPTVNIWNARRISTVILDGQPLDRDSLLHLKK